VSPRKPKRKPPYSDEHPEPASLVVRKRRGGVVARNRTEPRVRTMVYLDQSDADWYAQQALESTGKQKRRNDLIETVLKNFRRSAEQGGLAFCAIHGEQGCFYCANPSEGGEGGEVPN
jgi:hypothetical protein